MLIDCFVAEGCYKPYTRMTQRGKYVKKDAQEYIASQTALGMLFKQGMNGRKMIERGKPLKVDIYIFHSHGWHHRDIDNMTKAVCDAAQGIIYEDDRWIDEKHEYRRKGDRCRIELWVKVL